MRRGFGEKIGLFWYGLIHECVRLSPRDRSSVYSQDSFRMTLGRRFGNLSDHTLPSINHREYYT
ncbi:MAG: hypothetical protein RJQ09_12015 [Cyclobacteriaceae bacterium]